MTTKEIKKIIEAIINDSSGVVCDDDGNGCGGPGYLNPDTLILMLDTGDFDDAVEVDFDIVAAKKAFLSQCKFDKDTKWIQIEFNHSNNGYYQFAWVWNPAE